MNIPCDIPDNDGKYRCPYMNSEDDYVSCRDYCGEGVDEDSYPEEEADYD